MLPPTINGYNFFECSSALQKAIRRADHAVAGYFALELWSSGYGNYVWKRLYTISAEDCWGLITGEIDALHNGYVLVNKGQPEQKGSKPSNLKIVHQEGDYVIYESAHLWQVKVNFKKTNLDTTKFMAIFSLACGKLLSYFNKKH